MEMNENGKEHEKNWEGTEVWKGTNLKGRELQLIDLGRTLQFFWLFFKW